MTTYSYSPAVAIDLNGNLVTSGTGLIYAVTDTGAVNPLTIRDENGTVITGGLDVTPLRLIPGFTVEDSPMVLWRSGAVTIPLSADGARIPPGGSVGQVLAKEASTNYAVGWIDPPAPSTGGGGGGGGGGTSNGDYWNRNQTAPVRVISATAPWPNDAPEGTVIIRLSGSGA